ncbi:MAG: hypothetical protein WCP36_03855 [Methanomicrobiales archaeon]
MKPGRVRVAVQLKILLADAKKATCSLKKRIPMNKQKPGAIR